MRIHTEQFQDRIGRLFPDETLLPTTREGASTDKNGVKCITRTITFQVTDACNLCCTYCYQINKKHHSMPFEVAKKFFDMIIEATSEDCDYINPDISPGLVIEFIGGEPFMEIDLIDKVSDYIIETMIQKEHKWANRFMFSICSNGVLYFDERVQRYIKKHREHLSFSISIDGNKELHDSCRIFPDGSGSYDIAISGVKHYREVIGGYMGSKMTLAPSNIQYAYDAVSNLIDIGYKDIYLNCVYEKGWKNSDARVLYDQLVKIADYLIEDKDRFEDTYLSIFDETFFRPKSVTDNENWCGGTGSMISVDYKGDIYPCIRYMESSLGDSRPPLKIGNINDGIMKLPEHIETVKSLRAITRKTQSERKCYYCPIADGCSWCSAYNYQEHGTADKRTTYLCQMHKARTLANAYLWNKGYRKYSPDKRFIMWIPKEWALEIITEKEWFMLKELESVTPEDKKNILEYYKNDISEEGKEKYELFKNNGVSIDYTNQAGLGSINIEEMLDDNLELKSIILE